MWKTPEQLGEDDDPLVMITDQEQESAVMAGDDDDGYDPFEAPKVDTYFIDPSSAETEKVVITGTLVAGIILMAFVGYVGTNLMLGNSMFGRSRSSRSRSRSSATPRWAA